MLDQTSLILNCCVLINCLLTRTYRCISGTLLTSDIVAHTGVLVAVTRGPSGADGSGDPGPTGAPRISRPP